jgi:hypothetical protein
MKCQQNLQRLISQSVVGIKALIPQKSVKECAACGKGGDSMKKWWACELVISDTVLSAKQNARRGLLRYLKSCSDVIHAALLFLVPLASSFGPQQRGHLGLHLGMYVWADLESRLNVIHREEHGWLPYRDCPAVHHFTIKDECQKAEGRV